jgi:chromosome condensin MukBEF MukE localization factor
MAILLCACAELLKKANNRIVAKVVRKKNFMRKYENRIYRLRQLKIYLLGGQTKERISIDGVYLEIINI